MFDSGERGEVNYQTQIVTKLPNENIQNYQLEIFESGGGKLPNTNCDQTTKWNIQNYWLAMFWGGGGVNYQMQIVTKLPNENIQNIPTRNVWFSGEGGGKLPNTNCDQITEWKYPKLPTSNVLGEGVVNYQMQIVTKLPNENIQNYQLEMFESGGGNCQMQIVTKLPNENIQKLPTRNVRFWWGAG